MNLNVVILRPWNNEDEIQVLFIKIYIRTSTCRTHLIRCALDRSKSGLSPEFQFYDIHLSFCKLKKDQKHEFNFLQASK